MHDSQIVFRPLTSAELTLILQKDQQIFPTDDPVSPKSIQEYFQHLPTFGAGYSLATGVSLAAVSLAIPLNESGWRALISGEISESGVTTWHLFDPERDDTLGIHWYHREVLDKSVFPSKFYLRALEDLGAEVGKIPRKMGGNAKELRIVGFSALAVSPAGIGLNRKLGLEEKALVLKEYVLREKLQDLPDHPSDTGKPDHPQEAGKQAQKGGDESPVPRCKLVTAESEEEARKMAEEEGLEFVNRINMMVLEPGTPSVIWEFIKPVYSCDQ